MLISLCTPNMGRTHDLRQVMPGRLEAAWASPPVEIVVVNYNSRDDLETYIQGLKMPPGVSLNYRKYTGRDYYHMAHAFNLAALAAEGEYLWIMGTDAILRPEAISLVRRLIEERQDDLMYARKFTGMIVVRKKVFVEAGGYDERFELYGQEGVELEERLRRRGAQVGYFSNQILNIIPTLRWEKVKNYRVKDHMTNMSRMMRPILEQCREDKVTIANEGKEWGSWT